MSQTVIQVENLSKRYKIGASVGDASLKSRVASAARNMMRSSTKAESERPNIFYALRDVSFSVGAGDVMGVIGHNGAGKSTLLKILSRIVEPTRGRIEIHGRIGSLLEVGTGFHPELTGRENIFLNGAILGMQRAEIERRFDEIVDFAGVERFIDTPVKRYSSGMYVRLAFAVAAHLEPEILIVDEVLAVGDAAFQRKCLGKMQDVAGQGRTVLFVSHNMAAVEGLCNKGICLESGRKVYMGGVNDVIDYYMRYMLPSNASGDSLALATNRSGTGALRLTGFHVEDSEGYRLQTVRTGMDITFAFEYECPGEAPRSVDIGFSGHQSINDLMLFVLYSSYTGTEFESIPQRGVFRCHVGRLALAPGRYRIGARAVSNGIEVDWPRDGVGFVDVEPGDFYGTGRLGELGAAPFMIDGAWEVAERWERAEEENWKNGVARVPGTIGTTGIQGEEE